MCRALLGGLLVVAAPAGAVCNGVDLFPQLRDASPSAFAALEADAAAMPFGTGRLFRVAGPDAEPSHIYGTLHLPDPRVATPSPAVGAALEQSRTLILELRALGSDAVSAQANVSPQRLAARPGRKSDHLLMPVDLRRLQRLAAERGLPQGAISSFGAAVLALLLDLPRCARARGGEPLYAERLLARLAEARGVPVKGLESLDEQIEALGGVSRETERDLLLAVMEQAERGEDVVETSIARWLAGDTGALLAWMRSAEPLPRRPQARMPPAFLDRLLDVRTRRMRDRSLPHLERGRAFVAIGAAHLPGRSGLLALLADAGYRIERLE